MHTSHPVEAEGRFVGVAVSHDDAWRFVAVHPSVEDIDGAVFPSPAEARRVAGLILARGNRVPARPVLAAGGAERGA